MKKLRKISITVLAVEGVLTLALFKLWNINLASLFPVTMIVYLILRLLRYSVAKKEYKLINFKYDGKSNSFQKGEPLSSRENDRNCTKTDFTMIVSILPFLLPFIFFFNESTKIILCIVMIIVWCMSFFAYYALANKKNYDESKKKEEQELKEQLEREQSGYIE